MINDENVTKKYGGRYITLTVIMIAIVSLIVGRLINLQIIHGQEYLEKAQRKSTGTLTIEAPRGEIYDRYGRLLVTNKTCYNVVINKAFLPSDGQNSIILNALSTVGSEKLTYSDTSIPITPTPYTFLSSDDETQQKSYDKAKKKVLKLLEITDESISADEVMQRLYKKYGLEDYTDDVRYVLVKIRYDMDLKGFNIKTPYTLASDVNMTTVTYIKENNVVLSGIEIETATQREYATSYAAHILGRTGYISADEADEYTQNGYALNEIVGKDGIEKTMEQYLRGTSGSKTVERLTDGTTNIVSETDPVAGKNVYLTIDLKLQETAEKSLASTIKQIAANGAKRSDRRAADARAGAVVVMDVNNAEVLAMASYPTYDLSTFNENFSALNTDEDKPLYNRAISGAYEPGSTFKMCTAVAGLKSGKITPNTSVYCDGIYELGNQKFYCWRYTDYGQGHGTVNVSSALKGSCNEFFYEVGKRVGIDTLNEWEKRFGFGSKTGIELEGESAGIIAGPDYAEKLSMRWYPGNTIQAAIGQSYNLMTPLQLVNYVSTVVNGGKRRECHLVKSVKDASNQKTVYKTQGKLIDDLDISGSTYNAIIKGMEAVVNEGGTAASVFKNYPIMVGGKSGTAQVARGTSTGVFVTFAPADNPKIAIAVVVEHGGSGNNVAPITRDILDTYFDVNNSVDYTTYSSDELIP